MKATLSAIGLGALIASACTAAFAAPTSTISQTGIGNAAYTEHTLVEPTSAASATIIQVGNNNRAGDPVAHTPGIIQRNITAYSGATALISQLGNENAAAIVQDGTSFPVDATIQQKGDRNSATLAQTIVTWSPATIIQTGTDNVAALDQTGADTFFKGTQEGMGNSMLVRQYGASHGGARLTQSGAHNSIVLDQLETLDQTNIFQVGTLNSVTATLQSDGQDNRATILQVGTGNTVTATQTGIQTYDNIVQKGNNNLATVEQSLGWNDALIKQIGNANIAAIRQTGPGTGTGLPGNTAYIKQVGDGFVASITQAGSDNHAGIYQH